jgi:hypothetical protein
VQLLEQSSTTTTAKPAAAAAGPAASSGVNNEESSSPTLPGTTAGGVATASAGTTTSSAAGLGGGGAGSVESGIAEARAAASTGHHPPPSESLSSSAAALVSDDSTRRGSLLGAMMAAGGIAAGLYPPYPHHGLNINSHPSVESIMALQAAASGNLNSAATLGSFGGTSNAADQLLGRYPYPPAAVDDYSFLAQSRNNIAAQDLLLYQQQQIELARLHAMRSAAADNYIFASSDLSLLHRYLPTDGVPGLFGSTTAAAAAAGVDPSLAGLYNQEAIRRLSMASAAPFQQSLLTGQQQLQHQVATGLFPQGDDYGSMALSSTIAAATERERQQLVLLAAALDRNNATSVQQQQQSDEASVADSRKPAAK